MSPLRISGICRPEEDSGRAYAPATQPSTKLSTEPVEVDDQPGYMEAEQRRAQRNRDGTPDLRTREGEAWIDGGGREVSGPDRPRLSGRAGLCLQYVPSLHASGARIADRRTNAQPAAAAHPRPRDPVLRVFAGRAPTAAVGRVDLPSKRTAVNDSQ